MEYKISTIKALVRGIKSVEDLPFYTNAEEWPLLAGVFPAAQKWHERQTRRNGRPYFEHCVEILLFMWVRGVINDRRGALAVAHDSLEEAVKDLSKDVDQIRAEAKKIFARDTALIGLMEIINYSDIEEEYNNPDVLIVRIADTTLNISDYHKSGSSGSMRKYLRGKAMVRVGAFQRALGDLKYTEYERYILGSLWSIERHMDFSRKIIDRDSRVKATLQSSNKKREILSSIPTSFIMFWSWVTSLRKRMKGIFS